MAQQHAELPMQLSKEFAKIMQPLLDVHLSAAMATRLGPAKSLTAPTAKPQLPRSVKGSHSTQAKTATPLPTLQPSAAGMGTDSSGAASATPAGSVSVWVEPFEADVTPAMPMDDWATDMWEQRVAPQMGKTALKVVISKSSGILKTPSTPSPIPSGKPRAAMEALKKIQEAEAKRKKEEAEAKRKKEEAKAKLKAKVEKEEENETSSSSSTDLETPSSEEEGPPKKTQAKKKGQKKPTLKAMVKTPSETKGSRNKRVLADPSPDAMAMPPPSTSSVARKKKTSIAYTHVGEYIAGQSHHEHLYPGATDGGRKPRHNDHNYKIKRNYNGGVE